MSKIKMLKEKIDRLETINKINNDYINLIHGLYGKRISMDLIWPAVPRPVPEVYVELDPERVEIVSDDNGNLKAVVRHPKKPEQK